MQSKIKAGYESIRLSFIKKNRVQKAFSVLSVPMIIYAVFLISGIISHTITDSGIPNEYRESANVLMTAELLKGHNPYSYGALQGELPPMIYLYGPLYSLITAGFCSVIGITGIRYDIVGIHYLVTFLCIIFTAVLGFIMIKKRTGSFTLSVSAFVFLITCSWRYNYVNAVPDSMGLFIMVLILFLLTGKSRKGVEVICALLTASVFFTKQYYLLIAGTVTIFLFLFKGIKSTFIYLLGLLVTFGAIAAFINWKCPLFWTYTLYLAKGPGTGVASTVRRGAEKMSGSQYNLSQIMSLGGIFLMFFITETAGCLYYFRGVIKNWALTEKVKDGGTGIIKTFEGLKKRVAEAGSRAGVDEFDCLMLIHLGVSGICLTYLGRNDGAWLSYYLELFMPALIMGALNFFHKMTADLENKERFALHRGTYRILAVIYFIIFMGFTIYKSSVRLPVSPLSGEDHSEWKAVQETLDQNPGDMYLYPHLAYYGIDKDIYIYNTGQPFVVSERFYKSYHKHPDKMEKYPHAEEIFASHFAYRQKILEKVKKGEYSAVSYIEGTDEVFDREDLASCYTREGRYSLRTGRQVWDTEIWIRK